MFCGKYKNMSYKVKLCWVKILFSVRCMYIRSQYKIHFSLWVTVESLKNTGQSLTMRRLPSKLIPQPFPSKVLLEPKRIKILNQKVPSQKTIVLGYKNINRHILSKTCQSSHVFVLLCYSKHLPSHRIEVPGLRSTLSSKSVFPYRKWK